MGDLDALLRESRVLICAGSGGVGKTTTAASIAVRAAYSGLRTVVMTIDPARRLANSLGIRDLGGKPAPVSLPGLGAGSLDAMMLDQKGAWDELVDRHAPNAEARERILANRFYQSLSETFAGSQEYMAIEQLCDLYESDRYDLVVVDTPPTRHALDFLEAPQRLADFLDRNVIKWFVKPYFAAGWSTMQIVNRTAGMLFRRLEEATGISALVEVSEFFAAMSGLFDGFELRVRRVYELLRSPDTSFVLVATPEEQVLREGRYFSHQVAELDMALRAVVFNRVHHIRNGDGAASWTPAALESELAAVLGGEPHRAARLARNFQRYEALAFGDASRIAAFRAEIADPIVVIEVPNFDGDVHSVSGLRAMHRYLFPAPPGGDGGSTPEPAREDQA